MTPLQHAAQQALEALEAYATHRPLPGPCPVRDVEYALRAALAEPVQEPVATITECEACFTPDVCQLRGTCDHYAASQLRVATQPKRPAEPVEPVAGCAACGKKDAEGWALYCIRCAEKFMEQPAVEKERAACLAIVEKYGMGKDVIANEIRARGAAALAEPVLVQGELPPRYVARSPIQAEPMQEPVQDRMRDCFNTHGPGCWSWGLSHHLCALHEIDRLLKGRV